MTITSNLQVGSIRLRAKSEWAFFPFENTVLARRNPRQGNLQISLAYADDLPTDPDHEACAKLLREFIDDVATNIGVTSVSSESHTLFGCATIHDQRTFRRYWYRFKDKRLLLALYQCDTAHFEAAADEIREADEIASSMEFAQ
jgi:hypothetical protein